MALYSIGMKKFFIKDYHILHPRPKWLLDIIPEGKPKNKLYVIWVTPLRKVIFIISIGIIVFILLCIKLPFQLL